RSYKEKSSFCRFWEIGKREKRSKKRLKAYNYKYNSKEYQDELSLNVYDYGARNYDPAIGRWMNIDPLAEKHPEISPYIYCKNNPVVFVDPDGRDFGIYIDFVKGTVTIKGTYYATSADQASANQATNYWKNQSGKFNYSFTDENGNKQSFAINYDLSVQIVTPNAGESDLAALNRTLDGDISGEGNVYRVLPDAQFDPNTNGSTSMNYVTVRNSKKSADTGSHEVGHSLGIYHFEKGLMTDSSTDPNRTNNVYPENVSNTVYSPIKSTASEPEKVAKPRGGAGRATLHLEGTTDPRAPQTNKGYRRLRNGTVK
ncbi:RHS repeat-associated protein, partial [Flavobacterium croceum DSM 17960]